MKTKEIAEIYRLDKDAFENFLRKVGKQHTEGFLSVSVDDSNVDGYVREFKEHIAQQQQLQAQKRQAEQARIAAEEQAKQEKATAMAQMLISSGFSFDGYKIVKYSGYISGDDATQIPRSGVFGGNNGENLTSALVKIRRRALIELKEAAYALGCNAVVGVDFDYITLEPETANFNGGTLYEPYIICVTANGNAVMIEKED